MEDGTANKSNELFYTLALMRVPAIGPASSVKLINHFGSVESIFKAGAPELLAIPGINKNMIEGLQTFKNFSSIEKEISFLEKNSVHLISFCDANYPPRLKQITGYPAFLFVQGEARCLLSGDWLGVVGARRATDYGIKICQNLVGDLVLAGVRIVSGFAQGIDITAHLTAIEHKGFTVAVLGGGHGCLYPPAHRQYVNKMLDHGAIISEFSPFTPSLAEYFPRRNRIISGLSRGTLVVEAEEKSGALITATYANEQNRDVFAVPGSALSTRSRGCHRLIQQGAKLVMEANDILEDWKYLQKPSLPEAAMEFSHPDEKIIFDACAETPLVIDEIVEKTGYPSAIVMSILSKLEFEGKIKSHSGGRYGRR